MRGLSLVVASGGHSSSRCAGLSLSWPLLLQSTGSRRAGSVIVAHRPSCSTACGIFPDQGSNPCSLHWQADSQPLRHQGSPLLDFIHRKINLFAKRSNFIFSFPIFIPFLSFPFLSFPFLSFPFLSFPFLTELDRTSSMMLKSSAEREHPCLVPDLSWKALRFSPSSMML